MGQKTALVVTAGLTIFVLMTGGLLAFYLYFSPTVQPVIDTASTTGRDAELVEMLLARDALYQERLAEANQTIHQANVLLQQKSLIQQATAPEISVTPTAAPELESALASAPAPAPGDDVNHYEEHAYDHEEDDDD